MKKTNCYICVALTGVMFSLGLSAADPPHRDDMDPKEAHLPNMSAEELREDIKNRLGSIRKKLGHLLSHLQFRKIMEKLNRPACHAFHHFNCGSSLESQSIRDQLMKVLESENSADIGDKFSHIFRHLDAETAKKEAINLFKDLKKGLDTPNKMAVTYNKLPRCVVRGNCLNLYPHYDATNLAIIAMIVSTNKTYEGFEGSLCDFAEKYALQPEEAALLKNS